MAGEADGRVTQREGPGAIGECQTRLRSLKLSQKVKSSNQLRPAFTSGNTGSLATLRPERTTPVMEMPSRAGTADMPEGLNYCGFTNQDLSSSHVLQKPQKQHD